MKMKKYTREERIVVWGLIILFDLFAAFVISTKDTSLFNIEASAAETISVVDESIYNIPAALPDYIPTLNISIPEDIQHLLYNRCEDMGMDYALMLGIMDAESDFDSSAISYTGVAHGIMQINYDNDSWLIEDYGFDNLDNIEQNAIAGIIIYQDYLERFGTVNKALMAYNMGPSGARVEWDKGNYSTPYVEEVLICAEHYRQLIAEAEQNYYMGY